MNFNFTESLALLDRTPKVLHELCYELSELWIHTTEGPDSWSAYDIVGHLIHGEKTDWIPRARIILSEHSDKTFPPFDRFAQFEASKGKTMNALLSEFSALRKQNIVEIKSWMLQESDWKKTGVHPEFGNVTLEQLIATWTVHDLVHINQMTRVIAGAYREDIGPWLNYINLLKRS